MGRIRSLRQISRNGILLGAWMQLVIPAQAQVDSLFRLDPDQRILRLWQAAPFITIRQPPFPGDQDTTAIYAQLDRLANIARQQNDQRLFWSI